MADRTEGSGRRIYKPKQTSLRAKLLAEFADDPSKLIERSEIIERYRVSEKAIQLAIGLLNRDGLIKTLYGPNRARYYALASQAELPVPKTPKQPKPSRAWSSTSYYVAPKPIVNSIFNLAGTL